MSRIHNLLLDIFDQSRLFCIAHQIRSADPVARLSDIQKRDIDPLVRLVLRQGLLVFQHGVVLEGMVIIARTLEAIARHARFETLE